MKLLITGGCGFLGSNLAAHAIEQGFDLCVFDNLQRLGSSENYSWLKSRGAFKFIHGDIRNQGDIESAVKSFMPTTIFHLAGQVAMTTSIANTRTDFEINTLGTLNVLEAIKNYAPKTRVIYSSTNKVYGDMEHFNYTETASRYVCQEHANGFSEDVGLNFQSPYGCSKGAADQYLLDYHRIYGIETMVFRHSSMYGGRQFATFDQGWIGWFCQMAINTKNQPGLADFTIAGNGKQVRDVLHVHDMINLYFVAAKNFSKAAGQAFNVGGGYDNSLSLLELFSWLEKHLNIKLKYEKIQPRISDQKVFIANIEKAKKFFDWNPVINIDQGLSSMVDWTKHK